jgi:acyl-coenzyme A thioesterase 13
MGNVLLWIANFCLLMLELVDLGGSLAVASRGLFATGVSTDLSVTYLNSGGQVGDTIKAVVTCDKCK